MTFKFNIFLFVLFIFISLFFKVTESSFNQNRYRRSKARTLTFLPTAPTRIQYIAGIGIPVEDLLYESVTSGYVLKAEHFLPERAEEFTTHYLRPQTIHRRNAPQMMNETMERRKTTAHDRSSSLGSNFKSQQSHASTYRWTLYKAIEVVLSSSGLPGRTCILRSICEHAAAPLHYGSGILAELLHVIMTPSTSRDKFSNNTDNAYIEAERLGSTGRNCASVFKNCSTLPIDLITAVFDFDNFV